jgi:hypothetical protein
VGFIRALPLALPGRPGFGGLVLLPASSAGETGGAMDP